MIPVDFFDLYNVSLRAGQEIMDVYRQDFDVELKSDRSPITQADSRAHHSITQDLTSLTPNIPVLSEEGKQIPYAERCKWRRFWLVDPLDGTKEFVKKNGEFTVNIALIDQRYPVLGIIYAPALDVMYFGRSGEGAFKLEQASKADIHNEQELIHTSIRLPIEEDREGIRVVASRSHMSKETEKFIRELESREGQVEVVSSGSSLKFCLVAEGKADYYPRFAPTMEWDTGAGQAIVEATGGQVIDDKDKKRLYYNQEDLTNTWFLVSH